MANKITIKNGDGLPANGTLDTAELGFDKTNEKLYVGSKDKKSVLISSSKIKFLEGVSSDVQTQLNGKVSTSVYTQGIDSTIKKTGNKQQIKGTSGDTALAVNSSSTSSYIEFLGNDTRLGCIGVDSNNQPVFYDSANRVILHSNNYKNYVTPSNIGAQAKHITKTVSLLSSNWSNKTQTVTVSGVTSSNTIISVPAPKSYNSFCEAGVYCSAQATNALTFICSDVPSINLTVNILILN